MGSGLDVVTGAFSYTGKRIATRLLATGRQVRTLTGHPNRPNPFAGQIQAFPYDFDNPDRLAEHLQGAETLYNTYWVRYPYGGLTYNQAVKNSRTLFQAAKRAGVQRIIHISIANPSKESSLPYYAGKARVEEALLETGVRYAIFRPTVIFSEEDILINNIAWMVRHFPIFTVPGDGTYSLQPIYVEDLADAMVRAGSETENLIRDAVGPEIFSFNQLLTFIAEQIGKKIHLVHTSARITYVLTSLLSPFLKDIILTREEIQGLMDNLLVSKQVPLGRTHLSLWLKENKRTVGTSYVSEIKKHF